MNTRETFPTPACARAAPLLPLLGAAGVEPDLALDISEHLRGCAYCQARRDEYARVDAWLTRRYGLASIPRRPTEEIMRHLSDDSPASDVRHTLSAPATTRPARATRRSFLQGIGAFAAVAALVAMTFALLHGRLGVAPGMVHNGLPRPSFPGTRGVFADVAMVSPDEGWALAQVAPSSGATDAARSVVFYHYLHGAWTPVTVPASTDLSAGGVGGFNGNISMDSPADGWAVAHNWNQASALFHYASGAWSAVSAPELWKVQALSPTSVWAISGEGYSGIPNGLVHFDGHTWTQQDLAAIASGSQATVVDLQMVSDREGWALARLNEQGEYGVLRYDGSAWTLQSTLSAGQFADFSSLAMVSPTEGWALAQKTVADSHGDTTHVPLQQLLYHYTGGKWSSVPLSVSGDPYTTLGRVTMVSPTEGWIVGVQQRTYPGSTTNGFERHPVLLRYTGGQWSQVDLPDAGAQVSEVDGLAFAADGSGWAAGYLSDIKPSETVQDSDVQARGTPQLWRYAGGQWSLYKA